MSSAPSFSSTGSSGFESDPMGTTETYAPAPSISSHEHGFGTSLNSGAEALGALPKTGDSVQQMSVGDFQPHPDSLIGIAAGDPSGQQKPLTQSAFAEHNSSNGGATTATPTETNGGPEAMSRGDFQPQAGSLIGVAAGDPSGQQKPPTQSAFAEHNSSNGAAATPTPDPTYNPKMSLNGKTLKMVHGLDAYYFDEDDEN